VGDIRTPWSKLPLITFEALRNARVSNALELFDVTQATHLMVIESSEASVRLRGVVSRTRLERQVWQSI